MSLRKLAARDSQGPSVGVSGKQPRWMRVALVAGITSGLMAIPGSAPSVPWRIWAFQDKVFSRLPERLDDPWLPVSVYVGAPQQVPPDWQVVSSALADVTDDGAVEWVLLVWRAWQDWPIQRWSSVPSPIAGFRDASGESCQLILLDPRDGHEIWAGSALPTPLTSIVVGDVDGDGRREVVALEGDYAASRDGPATHVDVWGWNGFGFTLEWRSPAAVFRQVRLTDGNGDGTLDIAAR